MPKLTQRLGGGRYQADEHYARALEAFRAGKLGQAQDQVNKAIELLPGHAEYQAMAGWIHHEQGNYDAAGDAYDVALGLNPYEMLANYGSGMLAYRAKDWDAAAAYFRNALAARPERAETLYYLALVSHRRGENARALHWMRSAAAAFAGRGDEREDQCRAWIREFDKLLRAETARVQTQ